MLSSLKCYNRLQYTQPYAENYARPPEILDFQLDYFNNGNVNQLMIDTQLWEIYLTIIFVIMKTICDCQAEFFLSQSSHLASCTASYFIFIMDFIQYKLQNTREAVQGMLHSEYAGRCLGWPGRNVLATIFNALIIFFFTNNHFSRHRSQAF